VCVLSIVYVCFVFITQHGNKQTNDHAMQEM